jgi:hypothetical protein
MKRGIPINNSAFLKTENTPHGKPAVEGYKTEKSIVVL